MEGLRSSRILKRIIGGLLLFSYYGFFLNDDPMRKEFDTVQKRSLFPDAEKETTKGQLQKLIYNGDDTPTGRYPYHVNLVREKTGDFYCGGTLIAPDVVLTAAHCETPKHVSIGTHSISDNNENIHKVSYAFGHPYFVEQTFDYDMKLLKLEMPSHNPLILLNDNATIPILQDWLTVIGFGRTRYSRLPSNTLQEVALNAISNQICEASKDPNSNEEILRNGYKGKIFDNMFCLYDLSQQGKDACTGDSGGPAIQKGASWREDVQVGIVSWGLGCGLQEFPGVYARISHEITWLRSSVCSISDFAPRDFGFHCEEYFGSKLELPYVPVATFVVTVSIEFALYPDRVSWAFVNPVTRETLIYKPSTDYSYVPSGARATHYVSLPARSYVTFTISTSGNNGLRTFSATYTDDGGQLVTILSGRSGQDETKTSFPVVLPTVPTSSPTMAPSSAPSSSPTPDPTKDPSSVPTPVPSSTPTPVPSVEPTPVPSSGPTLHPTTAEPTFMDLSQNETIYDDVDGRMPNVTIFPTAMFMNAFIGSSLAGGAAAEIATTEPTGDSDDSSSKEPSSGPSFFARTTIDPSPTPTESPLEEFETRNPTLAPSNRPTEAPTLVPTARPTTEPTKLRTNQPTNPPTRNPTSPPSEGPSESPTFHPTSLPSAMPTTSFLHPSDSPSLYQGPGPTKLPTTHPSIFLSLSSGMAAKEAVKEAISRPLKAPTGQPTSIPSELSSHSPSERQTSTLDEPSTVNPNESNAPSSAIQHGSNEKLRYVESQRSNPSSGSFARRGSFVSLVLCALVCTVIA